MMPQITVSPPLFERIKNLAEPFVDTSPESVIERLVAFYESNRPSKPATPPVTGKPEPLRFMPEAAPDLTFTRVLSVDFDGQPIARKELYWNALLMAVVTRAAKRFSKDELKRLILVNFVEGEKSEQGYRFIPEAGLSIQGQDANAAWKAILRLTKALGVAIEVTFMWEEKDRAAHPGATGRMSAP